MNNELQQVNQALNFAVTPEAVAEIAERAAEIKTMTAVASDADARKADTLLTGAKKLVSAIGKERLEITRQADKFKKLCMTMEADLVKPLEAEITRLAGLQVAYINQKKAEAEKARIEALMDAAETGVAPNEAVMAEPTKPAGVKARTYYGFRITNGALVPKAYCIPDEMKIREFMNYELKNGHDITALKMDGVEFYKETRV